ncbi:MFS transporter small subunit [Streptomyces lasiicapitis]
MTPSARPSDPAPPRRRPLIVGAWLWVGLPLAYGVYELVHKAKQLFTG